MQDDYETAAILRDEANALEKRMEAFAASWEEKMNQEPPAILTPDFIANLITQIEAALEALSSGDTEKITEIKARLRALKSELLGELPENE